MNAYLPPSNFYFNSSFLLSSLSEVDRTRHRSLHQFVENSSVLVGQDTENFINNFNADLSKGTTLTTKKSMECTAVLKKHTKDFGDTLDDPDVMKLCGCSRNSYYKYKREIKNNLGP